MAAFLAKRLLLMVPTFLGITLLTFVLAHLAPGDPLTLATETPSAAGREVLEQLKEDQGLHLPLHQQYARWLSRVVRLDFGRSTQDLRPVTEKIGESLPKTLLLSFLALFFSYVIAVPLGVLSAVKRGTLFERVVTVGLFVLYSLPSFWVAVMLLLYFAGGRAFDWFPMQGLTSPGFEGLSFWGKVFDVAWHLVLPVVCLSYASLASISRYMRSGMLEVIRQDYIRTARAKGLPERVVVFKHALRNGILPVVTLLGLMLPHLLGGSVVVERIFGIQGMGLLALEAIFHRDYPMVMGVTTLVALFTMGSTLLADVLYALFDPRIGVEEAR